MITTYIGTTAGVLRLENGQAIPLGLDGERVWAIHAFPGGNGVDVVLAGSYGEGMFRSVDSGQTWASSNDGLTASAFRMIGPDPLLPGAILAGAEPGLLFRSVDGGETWIELSGLRALDRHEDWYLPYSPRAGAIRNVYAPVGTDARLLASVEVGGLLDSHDGGETWSYIEVGIDDDMHHITGHPDDGDVLFVSLGYASLRVKRGEVDGARFGGIARSFDGGSSWQKVETDYTRATLVPPGHPDLLLAGPAPRVGEQGRIVVSSDRGDTWEPASGGIETPMEDMVELFVPAPDGSVWAICSGGRLLSAEPGEWRWTPVVPDDGSIIAQSVAFVTRE
ncbi:MAG TPA: hypothetical protein VMM78_07200 [Thermomicrobiales bacterium]|nr:hypothetical protein [Thermomicrobiales bacterium]